MKHAVIKKATKLLERIPSSNDYSLSEIFSHQSFTKGSKQDKEKIMLKSSEQKYLDELHNPFDRFFELNLIDLLKGKSILDLGCFTGGRCVAWAQRYQLNKVYGIDVKKIFLKAAHSFSAKKNIKADFVCSVAEFLPFKTDSFDAILSFDVFEHVQDIKLVLSECYRVLKSKCSLFVVFPSYFHPLEHHLSLITATPFIHYFFSGKDLIKVYNEIINERGKDAEWYKRWESDLEPWERCNTINGITQRMFRDLIDCTNWNIYYENHPPVLGEAGKKNPILNLIRYIITPLARLRGFEEFLCTRVIYILQKP